jgi:hypothetical protein
MLHMLLPMLSPVTVFPRIAYSTINGTGDSAAITLSHLARRQLEFSSIFPGPYKSRH